MTPNITLPGFADPVAQAQATFRAVLDAMSAPGSLHAAGVGLSAPAPLCPAIAALLLTMIDGEAPLAIDAASAAAQDWIGFHCGAVFTVPAHASFALAMACPDLATLHAGSDEGPEEACTLLLQVQALGTGTHYRLTGPGLQTPATLGVAGLPDDFAARWAANHGLYPRGVDIILCAGTTLAALPRSVAVEPV